MSERPVLILHGGPIGGECSCPLKPANAKGKRHSVCCFHDEPGITVCTCGAGERDKTRRDGDAS